MSNRRSRELLRKKSVQNKLLKLAIGRLQNELEEKEDKPEEETNLAKVFLTENSNQLPAEHHRSMVENTITTAPNSVFEAGFSKVTVRGKS